MVEMLAGLCYAISGLWASTALSLMDACFAFAVSDSGRWVKLGRKVVKAQGKVSKNFDIEFRV